VAIRPSVSGAGVNRSRRVTIRFLSATAHDGVIDRIEQRLDRRPLGPTVKVSSRPLFAGPNRVGIDEILASALSAADLNKLIERNEQSARVQAELFYQQLNKVLQFDLTTEAEPTTHPEGTAKDSAERRKHFIPPTLVVGVKLQARFGPDDRAAIGKAYAAAMCSWFSTLRGQTTFR
jgi:hypothetical protein